MFTTSTQNRIGAAFTILVSLVAVGCGDLDNDANYSYESEARKMPAFSALGRNTAAIHPAAQAPLGRPLEDALERPKTLDFHAAALNLETETTQTWRLSRGDLLGAPDRR